MFSHNLGRALAIASAALLSACKTFSPDGGMSTVAAIAGDGLNKSVVRINSAEDASLAQGEVARRLKAPLSADAAVQIALLNNPGLQAAYNRLGIAEAVMVQASRPPLPIVSRRHSFKPRSRRSASRPRRGEPITAPSPRTRSLRP